MEMTKMEMKLDRHLLRKWRETRAWSQEHLAALAGLSLRTIQRIEADGRASAETRMALAAAFNVDVATLTAPETVPDSAAEKASVEALSQLKTRRSWYFSLLVYLCVCSGLVVLNITQNGTLSWAKWPLIFWGLALARRAARRFF